MNQSSKIVTLSEVVGAVRDKFNTQEKTTVYRFDIFKGTKDAEGKVVKIKTVGNAYLRDGLRTYTVNLKTFLEDKFYLLSNSKPGNNADYVILTREIAQNSGRKYFWNNVGEARLLEGMNHGILQLSWDVFGDDLYMNLHPVNVAELPEASKADAA